VFNVDADEPETKIKDLIVRERSRADFENEAREVSSQRDTARAYAADAREAAMETYRNAANRYKTPARTATKLAAQGHELSDDDEFMIEIRASSQARRTAERELAEADAFISSTANALARLSSAVHETRNIAEAWDKCSVEEWATLLGYWVHDVWVVSERIPGMKRANRKTAVVVVRPAPTTPHHFALGDVDLALPKELPATSRQAAKCTGSEEPPPSLVPLFPESPRFVPTGPFRTPNSASATGRSRSGGRNSSGIPQAFQT